MALTFDTGKAVQRLRVPLGGQEAAEAVVDAIAEGQQELVTTSALAMQLALLEKRLENRMLRLVLLQTGLFIGAVAAIEVFVTR